MKSRPSGSGNNVRGNVFASLPPLPPDRELFELLCAGEGVKIERILSHGQRTPPGEWLDQDLDEWVVLLQGSARLSFEEGGEARLRAGDWLFIAGHRRHRVEETSTACIWLAVHGTMRAL